MKQLFRCDYCDQTGTAEEIEKHEVQCIHNYTKRSCLTCKHKENKSWKSYACALNKEIPEGKYFEQCSQYEWDEKDTTKRSINNIFGMFGGL